MNILQKFLQLENNDILNKIYSYIGKHSIVEKTTLTDVITKYTMLLKTDFDYTYYYTPANKKTFSYFYFISSNIKCYMYEFLIIYRLNV